jgi:hypothetical protein
MGMDGATTFAWQRGGRAAVIGALLLGILIFLSAPPQASADVSAQAVAEYADEFGISDVAAETVLETQRQGAGIVDHLKEELGDGYAGVWFDNEAGEFVVPVTGSASRSAVARQLAAASLADRARTVPVQSTWGELTAAQRRVDHGLDDLLSAGKIQTYVDPRSNSVVVREARGLDASERAAVRQAAAGQGVEVEVEPTDATSLRIELEACKAAPHSVCDRPIRGGMRIQQAGTPLASEAGCTAGFKATGDTFGNRFILTAGHCYAHGPHEWTSYTPDEAKRYLGWVQAANYPGQDNAAINANGTYWDTPWGPNVIANWGTNQESPINYEGYSYLGQGNVCHIGSLSGKSCGSVVEMNVTSSTQYGTVINGLTKFQVICGNGGDSGGPVFTGDVALGIYTGSDPLGGPNESCNKVGYYSEITQVTDALQAHVAPRLPPPPPPPAWHSDNLGGAIDSKPAVASWSANRLDVFAKASNGNLLTKVWDGVQWSGWLNLGGQLASGPSAVSWGPGRIDVVARLANNTIGHWYYDGSWKFDNMGGLGGSFTSDPGISSWAPGRLDVFARGGVSNKLFHAYYDGTWKGWEDMGGSLTSGPSAVSWEPGRIDVVALAANSSVQHWYWTNAQGWKTDNLGGTFASEPGISSWAPGRLDVFARGATTNKLWHKWWSNGTGYVGWEDMGGSLTSGLSAVSWAPNRIDVFGRTTDNTVPHWWWG